MPGEQPFDVKRAIEQSASKTTIQELARKGIHRVKVLDEAGIQRLITEAVQRILSTRTNTLTDEERERIFQQSRKELDRLMQEHQQLKGQADLATQDKTSLVREVENLQEQLKLQRKMTEEQGRQRYDEGKSAMKQVMDDQVNALKERMGQLEGEIRSRVRGELDAEFSKRGMESNKVQYEEVSRLKDALARTEAALNEKVQIVANATASKEALEREAVDLRRKADEALAHEREAKDKLTKAHEDSRAHDEMLFSKMEQLFSKSLEGLNKKLNDLRLRAIAGGGMGVGAGAGGAGGGEEFRLSAASIEGMLKQELDSNIKGMEAEEQKTAGKIGGALERLKRLREGKGGG